MSEVFSYERELTERTHSPNSISHVITECNRLRMRLELSLDPPTSVARWERVWGGVSGDRGKQVTHLMHSPCVSRWKVKNTRGPARTSGDCSTRCPNLRVRIAPFSIYIYKHSVQGTGGGYSYSVRDKLLTGPPPDLPRERRRSSSFLLDYVGKRVSYSKPYNHS